MAQLYEELDKLEDYDTITNSTLSTENNQNENIIE